jgi:hypothetical protein
MPSQSPGVKKSPRFWWDDWMALLCFVRISLPDCASSIADVVKPFAVATMAMGIYLIHLGLGRHFNTVPPTDQITILKSIWATYFLYDTSISLAKSSALFFYARIFASADTKFIYALWAGQAAVWLWLFSLLLTVTFTCIPVQKSWQPEIEGKCQNTQATYLGSAISSVIIDLFILLLPMPMLWRLQMRSLQKILITGVFVCGYWYEPSYSKS